MLLHFCHDLRQQIATGRLLAATPDEPAELRLKVIGQLLDDIDTMISTEIDGTEGRRSPVDLAALIDSCVHRIRLANQGSIVVQAEHPLKTYGDATRLGRAIFNVLDNAVRAAGPDGEVVVHARARSGHIVVTIADDGPGFARISTVTGFGMQIVSEAVRGAGGSLHIQTGPEPGTTVELRLPSHPTSRP